MKDFLQITRTEINVGLKREYRFFQISDAHIAYIDEKSSEIDVADNSRSHNQWDTLKLDFARQFGEHFDEKYKKEAHVLLETLMAHALSLDVDMVIFSGDIMDRVTESNIRYLKDKLSKFPKKVIYCPGNHAYNDEFGKKRNMYERFSGLIDNPEFDCFECDEINIVTIDNGTKKITEKQLEKLKRELSKSKKILLVLHAPIKLGAFGKIMGEKLGDYFLLSEADGDNAKELIKIIKENDDHFIAVLAGHIHGEIEYPITEKLMQYTTSSALIGKGREIIIK